MKEIKHKYNVTACEVTDLASGLYTAAFGVGTILGPLIGAYLEACYGFQMTTDILAFTIMILFTIMIVRGEYKKKQRSTLALKSTD